VASDILLLSGNGDDERKAREADELCNLPGHPLDLDVIVKTYGERRHDAIVHIDPGPLLQEDQLLDEGFDKSLGHDVSILLSGSRLAAQPRQPHEG
jgi:hypothetical protein